MSKTIKEITAEIQTEPPEHLKEGISGHAEIAQRQEPSNKKSNYKLVDGEPKCTGIKCTLFENRVTRSYCQSSPAREVNRGQECIMGIMEQRDKLAIENVQLKSKTIQQLMKKFETMYAARECPNCGYYVTMNGESDD